MSISENFFRSALLAFGILAMFAACSADSQENTESEDRMAVGKADHFGSCENSCDGQSESGSCWCDDLCSEYGDCCDDAAAQCDVNECDAAEDTGCAQGEFCRPGLCFDFCPSDDFDCCAASTCQKTACPDLGSPPPDFCVNGESPEAVIDEDGCVVGFECPNPVPEQGECNAAENTGCAQGEFCRPGLCLYFCPTDDFDCCTPNTCQKSTPTCPDLSPPPPDFCVNGVSPEAVIDQDGCVVGFECPEPVQDECGDGTVPLCAIWVPECADGLVREVINYCYGDCVDPETCLAN